MIQRIQTVYLILAALAFASPVFLPFATANVVGASVELGENYFADGTYWAKEAPSWQIIIFGAIISLYVIFAYKNRPLQMRLIGWTGLVALLSGAMFAALGFLHSRELPMGSSVNISAGGAVFPLTILFLYLAYRAIRRDEDLVRSSDRLR
jgi:Na+/proline symporter